MWQAHATLQSKDDVFIGIWDEDVCLLVRWIYLVLFKFPQKYLEATDKVRRLQEDADTTNSFNNFSFSCVSNNHFGAHELANLVPVARQVPRAYVVMRYLTTVTQIRFYLSMWNVYRRFAIGLPNAATRLEERL